MEADPVAIGRAAWEAALAQTSGRVELFDAGESLTERRAWELYRDHIGREGRLFTADARGLAMTCWRAASEFDKGVKEMEQAEASDGS